jgi:hypothetical protein
MQRASHVLTTVADVPTSYRVSMGEPEVEHRFRVDWMQAQAFLGCVSGRLSADIYDPDRPVSFLLTTYYDTADHRMWNSSGNVGRARVRLRQYASAVTGDGPAMLTDTCAFEVKLSIFESRRMARVVGAPRDLQRLLHGGAWRDPRLTELRALRHAARAVGTGKLRPVLSTYFRRLSRSAPGIRVTLDDCVGFARPVPLGQPGQRAEPGDVFRRLDQLVLEVKLSAPPPPWLTDAMRLVRLTGRESKFHDGMLNAQRIRRSTGPVQVAV